MLKKISLLLILSTFLVSCGDETDNSSWLITVDEERYSMQIPSTWEIIEDKENILPKASEWEIELAVTSTKVVNWFSNNLLILSWKLNKMTTSKEYSMLNNVGTKTDYLEYKEKDSKEIIFADEEVWMLYNFEARYNLDTPKLRFIQTAHICNQTDVYFMTIALPSNITDTSKYEYLLSSFKCK